MRKPLTVSFYIGGKQIEKLTDEQCEKMMQRLTEVMSRYYANHIDEFKALKSEKRS